MAIKIGNPKQYYSDKIKSEEEAIKIAEEERRTGKKVGLCVGGFDLLHPGHMTHLNSAKKLCDLLIVGVTSAKYNSLRKGRGRPIYNDTLRCFAVSQLEAVDLVFLSERNTNEDLIRIMKPNYYIKGKDYSNTDNYEIASERQAIESVGGQLLFTRDEKLSTSGIINYILENLNEK